MNKLLTGILLILSIPTSNTFGQTQIELNAIASKQYKSSDSTLNSVYNQIINVYSVDTSFIKNLKLSHQLWMKFRDAELKMKFPDSYIYGSIEPLCVSQYLTELTNVRIKTLRIWIDGIEEGDLCSGSVKRKIQSKSNKETEIANEFCDTTKVSDFKINLTVIAEELSDKQKKYQLKKAKDFITQSCERDTLFCGEIKFKNTTTYKFDNEWKLLLTGFILDKQTGIEEKSASFFVLTILRNNEFVFTDILEDVMGEIQAELNGFEVKEKQITIWGRAYPYFHTDYGKFRLKIENGTKDYEFQCYSLH